jgi:class 3 adenylate cyclase
MATAGLLTETEDHALQLVQFARAAQHIAGQVLTPLGDPIHLRVGIHSGRVMSGIVGTLRSRYCLFGGTWKNLDVFLVDHGLFRS